MQKLIRVNNEKNGRLNIRYTDQYRQKVKKLEMFCKQYLDE